MFLVFEPVHLPEADDVFGPQEEMPGSADDLERQLERNFGSYETAGLTRLARLSAPMRRGMFPALAAAINIRPVYLGSYFHATFEVTTSRMMQYLTDDAATWSDARYRSMRPLADLFVPNRDPGGTGFVLNREIEFSIDHVVPQDLGGLHHPRNYAIMVNRVNSSYNNRDWAEKIALLGQHNARLVFAFMREYRAAMTIPRRQWLMTLRRPDGTTELQ